MSSAGPRTAGRRALVIVNPYATTVSPRVRAIVLAALASRFQVEAVDTERPGHATELARAALDGGHDLVVPFGGDGTVSEVAAGLAGSDTPLSPLPGGATNVFARILGVPRDVLEATNHLLEIAAAPARRVDLGMVNGRHFVFASGVGLDASVVGRVDSRPVLKSRLRQWYFAGSAISTYGRRYLVNPPLVSVETEAGRVEGVTAIAQNADPFTYFGSRPIHLSKHAGLDSGGLALAVLRESSAAHLLTLLPRLLSGRPSAVAGHSGVEILPSVKRARVTSVDGRPFPLEADGDYLGDVHEAEYECAPDALGVLS